MSNAKKQTPMVEWQKYDANIHIMMMQTHTETLSLNTLNVDRIKIFVDRVKGLGSDLQILDVGCREGILSELIMNMGN